jgi:predicted permease
MFESQIVLLKIGMMFLVMLAGWWTCRQGYLNAALTRALSVWVVQVTFPALVFTQMLVTVNGPGLRRDWWVPILAAFVLAVSGAVGYVLTRLCRVPVASRRTVIFVTGVPNWVFLPLPIVESLYGADGVRLVLMFNVGAQVMLWTVGVRTLLGPQPGETRRHDLVTNPGILATVAGIAVALLWPQAATLGGAHPGLSPILLGDVIVGALRMLGDLTIPLSLLVTGAQLRDAARTERADLLPLAGVVAGRLFVAPAAVLILLKVGATLLGLPLTGADFITIAIIATMPVAVSCTMFVERFGGDRKLTATGIFYTTLLSLVTVPLAVLICRAWIR